MGRLVDTYSSWVLAIALRAVLVGAIIVAAGCGLYECPDEWVIDLELTRTEHEDNELCPIMPALNLVVEEPCADVPRVEGWECRSRDGRVDCVRGVQIDLLIILMQIEEHEASVKWDGCRYFFAEVP